MGVNRLWTAVEPTVSQCALDEFIISEGFHPCNINGTPQLMHIGFDASLWMHAVCSAKLKHGKHVKNAPHFLIQCFQELLSAFGFTWHEALGKAEAELAKLNAVFLDDSDILLFGAPCMI
ncbi:hypothetical protein V8B97DRAFT_2022619 [Scleroderma yunnanense]